MTKLYFSCSIKSKTVDAKSQLLDLKRVDNMPESVSGKDIGNAEKPMQS